MVWQFRSLIFGTSFLHLIKYTKQNYQGSKEALGKDHWTDSSISSNLFLSVWSQVLGCFFWKQFSKLIPEMHLSRIQDEGLYAGFFNFKWAFHIYIVKHEKSLWTEMRKNGHKISNQPIFIFCLLCTLPLKLSCVGPRWSWSNEIGCSRLNSNTGGLVTTVKGMFWELLHQNQGQQWVQFETIQMSVVQMLLGRLM